MDCNGGTIDDCSTCDEKLHRLDSADDATSACVCDYRHSYYDVYDTASDSLMC